MSQDRLLDVIRVCATMPQVREDVIANHDDNRWWPLSVTDWRLRLVLAGWSTRVSYNMISTYQAVVGRAIELGYGQLSELSDDDAFHLVAPIGLPSARIKFLRSVARLLENGELDHETLLRTDHDVLIEQFATRVKGSRYKVAQCAILYAKGYHCGIFPVDSGMKDMLGPCLGLRLPKGPRGHEVMRKQMEALLQARPDGYYDLAQKLGYTSLHMPKGQAPIWWAHLVLIYFKRRFCNKHAPHVCPLRSDPEVIKSMGKMCDRENPEPGGCWLVH